MILQRASATRLHSWLFLAAFLLSGSLVAHAAFTFTHQIPATFVVVHAVAASTCWIVGELRRQWQHRVDRVVDLATEITAANR